MRTLLSLGVSASLALVLVTACVAGEIPAAADARKTETVTATFAVQGMTCGGCEAGVEMKVGRLAGVETVEASYKESRATVTYAPDEVTPEAIVAAIEELGYTAKILAEDESPGSDPHSAQSSAG